MTEEEKEPSTGGKDNVPEPERVHILEPKKTQIAGDNNTCDGVRIMRTAFYP